MSVMTTLKVENRWPSPAPRCLRGERGKIQTGGRKANENKLFVGVARAQRHRVRLVRGPSVKVHKPVLVEQRGAGSRCVEHDSAAEGRHLTSRRVHGL